MTIDRELTEEEAAFVARLDRSSWTEPDDAYRARDLDRMVEMYTEDCISTPAHHSALRGHDDVRAWYARRTGDYAMNAISDVDSIEIVGDVAVLTGTFRVTRAPEEGVAGLDHGGRWLSVFKRVDDTWRMWRDMDTPSPDADKYYGRLARGL